MPKRQKLRMALLAAGLLLLMNAAMALTVRLTALQGLQVSEYLSLGQQLRVRREIDRAGKAYRDRYIAAEKLPPEYSGGAQRMHRADLDAFEELLMAEGFAVVDADEIYPAYLANQEPLYAFWGAVSAGEDGELTLIRVNGDGGLSHLFFSCKDGEVIMALTDLCWGSDDRLYVWESEVLPIYDLELTDWGIFYYQNYPDDPHYINYNQIRITPVDRDLYDLNRKYVQCVGYWFTNLFLCDWSEEDFGELCFNDVFEYLYADDTGKVLNWEQYPSLTEPSWFQIPAGLVEKTIRSYFAISPQKLRELAGYDGKEDCYLWRPVYGNDVTVWKYPMCEPEVLSCTQNGDGTMTLSVQVYSPELKTDRLFAHEVTVRPLENGKFQYVSNRVTYVGDRGLPPSMPRFALDGVED